MPGFDTKSIALNLSFNHSFKIMMLAPCPSPIFLGPLLVFVNFWPLPTSFLISCINSPGTQGMIHLDLKNWTDWRLKPRSPGHRKHLQLSNTVTMTTNNSGDRSGNSILLRSTSKLRNPHAHSVMYSESAMCQAFNTHTSFTPNHENWGSEKKADQGYTTRVRLSQESNPSLSNSRIYVPFTEPCPLSH